MKAMKSDWTVYTMSHFGEWVLDTTYPYKYCGPTGKHQVTGDSPFTELDGWGPIYIRMNCEDHFKMFIGFVPPGENSKWIPLKVVEWNWKWEAKKIAGNWTLEPGASANVINDGEGNAIFTLPEWDSNYEPAEWITP